jgi:hypothetical protein
MAVFPQIQPRIMKWGRHILFALLVIGLAFTASGDFLSTRGGVTFKTAREAYDGQAPTWTIDPDFKKDTFTFARVQYVARHDLYGEGHTEAENRWLIDFPLSDLDMSYRLQQMTSMHVDPDGHPVKIDTNLFDFPFIYMVEPGRGLFADNELPIMRKYLLNGGFLMVDDFWGDNEWQAFAGEMARVFPPASFPNQKIVDLADNHPIFTTVFPLKEKPQVPGIPWLKYYFSRGTTYEMGRNKGGTEDVHYRGIFDDKGRLIVMICHNTDLGDGWEREGDNEDYFRIFSEPKAFPMGINIIVYAMTH